MQAGMAGATVFAGREGFGESGQVHRTHLLTEDAPRTVVLIERAERIDAFLAEVADLVADALVTVEPLQVVDL
jgi:PII-like signaling protein